MPPSLSGALGCIGFLREQIQDSLVTSISERLFLPTDTLHKIFTLAAIKGAVKELSCGPSDRIKLADTIHDEGQRLFAMLIYNDCQDLIIDFRKHGALDSRLPLSEDDAVAIAGRPIGRRLAQEVQWMFYPYTFPESMWKCHREVEKKMILPFIGAEQIGTGAFSDVNKMSIWPSQQNFVDKGVEEVQVVRKQLKVKGMTKEFEREDNCLRLLNQLQHPNIIPLWGSYTYRGEQNFLFPYVDMDLGKFLMAKTSYRDFQWDFTFYSALTGLASALSKTHRLHLNQANHDVDFEAIGYHHDLRPPNVLVSADTFILADFGLGRLKSAEALSHTPYKSISGDYIAPECTDMGENPQTVNRAIDVWAFGCLIAEVVTYMLKGVDGVEEFRTKRLTPGRLPQWKDTGFYQPHGDVKQEVFDWMEALRRDNPHPDLVPQLVDLSLHALQVDPRSRPDVNNMHHRLAVLSLQKHIHSVQDMFREVCGSREISAPLAEHHLDNLRFAQERFKVWASASTLDEKSVPSYACEQSEGSVKIMKKLVHALREELENRPSGNRSVVFSLEQVIAQSVEDLWGLLPDNLLQSAKNQWQEALSNSEFVEQMVCSRCVALGDVPSASMAAPINDLQCEFEEAARVFKDNLPDSIPLDEILKVTSSNNFYDVTDKIQKEQQTRDGLRNLPKMQLYLARLGGYAAVINDIINGSRDVLALIWGPIALLLQWSRTLGTAYDSIINVAAEVGQALPDFQASAGVFDQSLEAKEILILFFKDLLNFYREALEPFSHPNWMHVFDRLWPKHYAHILEVARHIGRLTRLMRTEIRIEHIQQEHEFRKDALEGFKAQKRESRRQEFHRIITSLNPCRYDDTLYRLCGLRCKETGDWLFMNGTFTKWLNSSQEENRILWLKGIPGAGKTVLSSAIVDKLRCFQGTQTAFAFLTYQEAKTSALSITHSLIFQLARRDDELMAIICDSMVEDLKNDLTAASNILSSLIHYAGSVYLVIDGVDEISGAERGRFVTELLRLAKVCERLRIILSSRSEADIMRLLDDTAVVIPVHDHNEGGIKDYIHERSQYIFHTRKVFPKAQVEIRKLLVPLVSRAKGMFLYARLIMDMIATMHDMSEVLKELAVLPESLDDAYHRIIVRLGGQRDKRRSEQARRLLGWVACTSTPLTIEDAEQALVVSPGNRDQVFNVVAKLDVVEILGPIVETVDTYIRFVHFTAKEYISSPHLGAQLIDMNQATLDLAMRCIVYLCQRHHDPDLPAKKFSENVSTGQYSFHTFSSRMWFDLVCQYLRPIEAANPSANLIDANLIDAIQMLWEARKTQDLNSTARGEDESEDESDNESTFGMLEAKHPLLHQLLCRVSRFCNSSFQFTGKTNRDPEKDKRDPLTTSATSQRIRKALDDVLCNSPMSWLISGEPGCHENCAYILQYYGPRPFKCRFPQCEFWQHGFQKRLLRDRHERSHDNPLTCPVPGCESGLIGFLSERMLQSHFKQAHQSDPPQVSLDVQDLAQDEVEALLSDLVQKDQVAAVQKVLSTFPNALQASDNRHKLRILAAFAASGAMLELLKEPAENDEVKPTFDASVDCIAESIKGRNESTLRYLLSRTPIPKRTEYSHGVSLISQLVSNDWLEGMKIWAKWIRREQNISPSRGANWMLKELFGSKITIRAAASHMMGDQQLLCLWEDSGVVSLLGEMWSSRTLRYVAEFSCSITLAAYLLAHGANINHRRSNTQKTALHWAAGNTSAEGAEMVRFLLLNGADPEADQSETGQTVRKRPALRVRPGKKIREEEGAKGIHQWFGKTWDELVEETKRIRHDKEVGKELMSKIGEGNEIALSDRERIAN